MCNSDPNFQSLRFKHRRLMTDSTSKASTSKDSSSPCGQRGRKYWGYEAATCNHGCHRVVVVGMLGPRSASRSFPSTWWKPLKSASLTNQKLVHTLCRFSSFFVAWNIFFVASVVNGFSKVNSNFLRAIKLKERAADF